VKEIWKNIELEYKTEVAIDSEGCQNVSLIWPFIVRYL